MMKKAWLNKKYISKLATRWTAAVFSLLGFLDLFTSFSDVYPENCGIWVKISISIGILVLVWIISFVGSAIWFEQQKWLEVFEANNDCHVYVQYGDVFSPDEVEEGTELRNIVIPVNRCFDTIVDDDLVSSRTLHGIAFKKLYARHMYDESTLDIEIQCDLVSRQNQKFDEITNSEKRRGNLKRFSVGTVAEVKESSSCKFFLLALSTFDRDLTAHTTQQEYVVAMQRLIEYCNSRSQQYPVILPLIGAGLSRTKYSERAILEYIIKLLKMNKDLITSDIHIVVRNSGKETIPISDL